MTVLRKRKRVILTRKPSWTTSHSSRENCLTNIVLVWRDRCAPISRTISSPRAKAASGAAGRTMGAAVTAEHKALPRAHPWSSPSRMAILTFVAIASPSTPHPLPKWKPSMTVAIFRPYRTLASSKTMTLSSWRLRRKLRLVTMTKLPIKSWRTRELWLNTFQKFNRTKARWLMKARTDALRNNALPAISVARWMLM